jgi:hypothetical protein
MESNQNENRKGLSRRVAEVTFEQGQQRLAIIDVPLKG